MRGDSLGASVFETASGSSWEDDSKFSYVGLVPRWRTDIFVFSWWNDGSLRPVGSSNWAEGSACTWQDKCPNGEYATDYKACTGAIFENNLKVLYK